MSYALNPNQESKYRENSQKPAYGNGWTCVRCHRRSSTFAGRKVSLAPKGWICKGCQK